MTNFPVDSVVVRLTKLSQQTSEWECQSASVARRNAGIWVFDRPRPTSSQGLFFRLDLL